MYKLNVLSGTIQETDDRNILIPQNIVSGRCLRRSKTYNLKNNVPYDEVVMIIKTLLWNSNHIILSENEFEIYSNEKCFLEIWKYYVLRYFTKPSLYIRFFGISKYRNRNHTYNLKQWWEHSIQTFQTFLCNDMYDFILNLDIHNVSQPSPLCGKILSLYKKFKLQVEEFTLREYLEFQELRLKVLQNTKDLNVTEIKELFRKYKN